MRLGANTCSLKKAARHHDRLIVATQITDTVRNRTPPFMTYLVTEKSNPGRPAALPDGR